MVSNVLAIAILVIVLVVKWIGDNVVFDAKCSQMESEGQFLPAYKHEREDFKEVYDDLYNKEFNIIPKEYEFGMYQVTDALPQFAKAYTQEKAIKSGCKPPWVSTYNKYRFDPWEVWNAKYLPQVMKYVRSEDT